MILISHRGNLTGPNPELENSIPYIETALNEGFDVEIDLWKIGNELFLGHDQPQYPVSVEFLFRGGLWIHAKNLEVLHFLLKTNTHYFWHQNDDFTLTSKNVIWTYPNKEITDNSVIVCFDENIEMYKEKKPLGICSDYVKLTKKNCNMS